MDFLSSTMSLWIIVVATAVAGTYLLWRLRFEPLVIAIVLSGISLCVYYLSYTSLEERNYDGSSHLEYVRIIAEQLRLPDTYECGACAHPPLYYMLGAFWSKIVGGWMPVELGLSWFSLLLFLSFVVFALLIVRSCSSEPNTLRFAAILVVFWPSSIINSVRIHNDALASPLMLAALFFTAEWDRRDRSRDFYLALLICALALLTKSSGYAVAATLLALVALRLCSQELRRDARRFRVALVQAVSALSVLACVGFLAVGLRESQQSSSLCQKVLGHACDGRYVPLVVDSASRYVFFDASDFVFRMDTQPLDPARDYFFNRLMKSSLFGTMPMGAEFASKWHATLGALMSALLLALLAICLSGARLIRRADFRQCRVYLASIVIFVAFLLAFRLRAPNEFHEDFRHIFAVLGPMCLVYVMVVERLRPINKLLYVLSAATGVAMALVSAAFFVSAR